MHPHRRMLDRRLAAEPARPRPVEVRCGCAANGLVEVLATDLTTGRAARAEIRRTGGLTEAEIEREAAWVRGLRIQ